jgi:DNA-binding MarR family transcriptional regulator
MSKMNSPSDVTLLYLIKQVELAVRHHLDGAVATQGLTSLQYTALTVLRRHPGMTSAELSRNSFVRAQTMAQMIASLEARGLISRERDPKMRRQFKLHLTDAGRTTLTELDEPVSAVESSMTSALSPEKVDELRAALRECRLTLGGRSEH